ncbi:unnamed protein product [Larinioides sclopetarius]|uniref:Biogenesis of lysosome-related organelles complex 1 subunit 1 n=1 Tax=Larinioides sclopetarius TaxID=280406 RepID=A0AAV1ZUI6_9ARAC
MRVVGGGVNPQPAGGRNGKLFVERCSARGELHRRIRKERPTRRRTREEMRSSGFRRKRAVAGGKPKHVCPHQGSNSLGKEMLSSIVKEHQSKQAAKREELEKKRKEAVVAASTLTSALVDHLNVGVAQAYLNQKRLDYESKQLHANVTNFAKQTTQWLQLVENFSQVLKEIGDVENWARSIENDMSTISSALEYAYKVGQET